METDSDQSQMLRVAAGDRAAFADLFDRHYAGVVRFAQRYVGSPARAEELAQDVFLKLFRHAREYRPSASFRTFLFRVAANHCLNEVRRGEYRMQVAPTARDEADGEAEQHEPLHQTAAPDGDRPDVASDARELERAVGEALMKLSPRERMALVLNKFEGLSYRGVAEALETSEPAVKSLIHRATLQLARDLEARELARMPARERGAR